MRSLDIELAPDDARRLASLNGPFDAHLRQVELRLGVEIRNRGARFRLLGPDEGIARAVQAEQGFGHTATMWSKNIDNLHKMARVINTSIFVKNAPAYAGLALGGEGYTSFTIASPTGEGLTTALSFSRQRRCTLKGHFRIV